MELKIRKMKNNTWIHNLYLFTWTHNLCRCLLMWHLKAMACQSTWTKMAMARGSNINNLINHSRFLTIRCRIKWCCNHL